MATATKNQPLRSVMTPNPLTLETSATIFQAAEAMAGAEVGPIPVISREGQLKGMLTDRDIVVRVIAQHKDPDSCRVEDACSGDVATLPPDATTEEAVALMRERDVRRIPVVENDRVVGIVSLGDLAQQQDRKSALADISAAPPNN
jgi:CBS domain-containing protein